MSGEGWAEPWLFPLPWPPLADQATQIGLRPWGAGEHDAAELSAAWHDEAVARWTAVPPEPTEATARTWIRGEERRRAEGLAMDLVISQLDEPRVIQGEVGFVVVEHDKRWAEVGFWVTETCRGHGKAAAATRIFSEWVLRELPINRLFIRTQPDNPAAGRVADQAGYVHAGELDTGTVVWIRDRQR